LSYAPTVLKFTMV